MTNIALESFTTQYQNGDITRNCVATVKSRAVHCDVGQAYTDLATRGPPIPEGKVKVKFTL